jgi:hypothetical protein
LPNFISAIESRRIRREGNGAHTKRRDMHTEFSWGKVRERDYSEE